MISATFSNGVKIEARDQRRTYSHAWYVAGYHRLNNQPWSYKGFANSAKVAELVEVRDETVVLVRVRKRG